MTFKTATASLVSRLQGFARTSLGAAIIGGQIVFAAAAVAVEAG
jgi:hypothetical protein